MQREIKIENTDVTLLVHVGEDCVVGYAPFLTDVVVQVAKALIVEAQAAGKERIVILGESHQRIAPSIQRDQIKKGTAGIDRLIPQNMRYAWFNLRSGARREVNCVIPGFPFMAIEKFEGAQAFVKHLELLCRKYHEGVELEHKITNEKKLLSEFPIVADVQSIESYCHREGPFGILFGNQVSSSLTSDVHAACLLKPESKEGVLVMKSGEIRFTFPLLNVEILQGLHPRFPEGYTRGGCGAVSIDICADEDDRFPLISLYLRPGIWKVEPHPPVHILEKDAKFIPMWQRLRSQ